MQARRTPHAALARVRFACAPHALRMPGRSVLTARHDLMSKVRESEEIEPGRRQAEMAELVDNLKGDFRRSYMINFEQ
jgi:hypothetical protein